MSAWGVKSSAEDVANAAPPPDRRPQRGRPGWLEVAAVVLGQVVLGACLGLAWLAWSPKSVVYLIPNSTGGTVVIPAETENQIAADGRFLVLTALAGLAAGFLTWYLSRRTRGPIGLLSLVAGALLGAGTTSVVGRLLSSGTTTGPLRTPLHPPLMPHGWPMLLIQAFFGVLSYTALAGFTADPDLGAAKPPASAGPDAAPEG